MASWFRRAGANILRVLESALDPASAAGEVQLYSKDASGTSQLFARTGDGTIYQLTPVSAGGNTALQLVSGGYYFTPPTSTLVSGQPLNERLQVLPWYCPNAITIDRIGAAVSVAGDGGSVVRLGIYSHDAATARPGNLLLDAGTIAGDSATVQEIVINQALTAGWYWFAAAVQNAPVTSPTMRLNSEIPNNLYTSAQPFSTQSNTGYHMTAVAGALPDPFVVNAVSSAVPRIFVRTV